METIAFAGLTDRGRVREQNEDRWFADPRLGLYLVSDGMGGTLAGGLAAQIVVEALPPLLGRSLEGIADLASLEARDRVLATLVELSDRIRQESKGQPGLDGMGATVVLALIRAHHAWVAHMGDSRAYLLREGTLEPLTRDHSIVRLLIDHGDISPEEAAHHPSQGQLTRHVGMAREALPEIRPLELHPGDRLLLCSDGLTVMLGDEEVRAILVQSATPDEACRRLIAAANESGGRDNITALVASVR
jgi:protein phosphatase